MDKRLIGIVKRLEIVEFALLNEEPEPEKPKDTDIELDYEKS